LLKALPLRNSSITPSTPDSKNFFPKLFNKAKELSQNAKAFEAALFFAKKIDRKPAAFERSTNFFSLRKKVAKKAKTLQVYRFVSAWESMKERASPRRDVYFVPRKHSAEPRGVRTLHEFFMVCKTACTKSYSNP
jgi:hypothetical protein